MALTNRVAAVPTPTRGVEPTARINRKALAPTISALPTVKMNSARPRRLGLDRRIPTHDTRVRASSTYSSGTSQCRAVFAEPRLRARYSRGAISGWRSPARKSARASVAISAPKQYCITARRRVTSGCSVEATEVIITQLPVAEATKAT